MKNYTNMSFPLKKINFNHRLKRVIIISTICILVFNLSIISQSHAQEVIFNRNPFILIPFTLINYEGSLYHPFYLSFNNLPPQDLFFPFTLYPSRVLLPESSPFYNQYDFYHYTLFFPPLIYTPFEYPHWYSWFLPFMQGYRNDFESQEVIIAEDIKDDIEEFMENYLMTLDEAQNLTCQDLIQKFPEDEYVTDLVSCQVSSVG